jgi:hypothetical protein
VKAQADVTATGVGDQALVNAAYASGKLDVMWFGTLELSAPISIPASNSKLTGVSRFGSTLHMANGANSNAITVATDISHIELAHFNISGNKANQASGHGIQFGAADGRISDLWVQNAKVNGIYLLGSGTQNAYFYMDDVRVELSDELGIRLGSYTNDSKLHRVISGNNVQANFYSETANNELIGCEAFGSGTGWSNIVLTNNPWGSRIIGCLINDADKHGIELSPFGGATADHIIINGNTIWRNGLNTTNTYSGVYIDTTNVAITDLVVQGNTIWSGAGNKTKYAVQQAGGNNLVRASIQGNTITDMATGGVLITNDAGNNIVRNNPGFIASGEARTISGSLAAGNANAISFARQNPEAANILVQKVVVEITTPGGTALSVLKVGLADDAAGTNIGTQFFTGLDANSAKVNDSTVVGDTGAQFEWQWTAPNGAANYGWIVGQILTQNAASLAGKYYVTYIAR